MYPYSADLVYNLCASIRSHGSLNTSSLITKKYGKKECNEISGAIDFLLSRTPNLWSELEKNPTDEETALELSWTEDLAANYTTIFEAFCAYEE
jgi:hypothetical protein